MFHLLEQLWCCLHATGGLYHHKKQTSTRDFLGGFFFLVKILSTQMPGFFLFLLEADVLGLAYVKIGGTCSLVLLQRHEVFPQHSLPLAG